PFAASERLTISSGIPACSFTSSAVGLPWQPPSAMAFSSEGNRLDAMAKSGAIMLRSCTSPGETAQLIRGPTVSTAVSRFLPLILLPALYPAASIFAPLFPRFSRFRYRRLRGSVLVPCPPVRALWHRVHDGSL